MTITAVGPRQFIDDLGVLAQVLRAAARLAASFPVTFRDTEPNLGLNFYL